MTVAPDFFETEPRNWRARLSVSVELMRELSGYSDPEEMYNVFSRRMALLFPVTRQLSLSRRSLHFPQFRVTRFNLWTDQVHASRETQSLPVHEGGLLADLIYAEQPRVIDDLLFAPDDPASAYFAGQHSLLAIPLFDQGTAQRMLVFAREDTAAFPRDRIADLVLLSNLFGRATQTLILSQAVKEAYDAVDYELRSIAEIQKSLLPTTLPQVHGLDVAVHYQTAKRAGGDYYDFFPLPRGRLGVLIADASGHGAPAAVLMAMAHSIVHTRAEPAERPGELLTYLNANLSRQYTRQTGHFMTAFYAVFDPVHGSLSYASAGHNPPRLLRSSDGARLPLNRTQRLPLGIKPDEVYTEQSISLQAGDQVVFFTDGVIEAVNATGDVFGTRRIDWAFSSRPATAEQLIQAILRDLNTFTLGIPVADDRTLLVVKRNL